MKNEKSVNEINEDALKKAWNLYRDLQDDVQQLVVNYHEKARLNLSVLRVNSSENKLMLEETRSRFDAYLDMLSALGEPLNWNHGKHSVILTKVLEEFERDNKIDVGAIDSIIGYIKESKDARSKMSKE